jgi:hypothetical protein
MPNRPIRPTPVSPSRIRRSGLPDYGLDLDWRPDNYGERKGPFPRRDDNGDPFRFGRDPRDVEIASIDLQYQHCGEGVTFLARRQGGRYHYRAEDEMGNEFVLCRKSSLHPLTLEEVILLVHTSCCPDYDRGGNGVEIWWEQDVENGCPPREPVERHTVGSWIYDGLGEWFHRHGAWWARDRLAAQAEEEGRSAAEAWRRERERKAQWARWKADGT